MTIIFTDALCSDCCLNISFEDVCSELFKEFDNGGGNNLRPSISFNSKDWAITILRPHRPEMEIDGLRTFVARARSLIKENGIDTLNLIDQAPLRIWATIATSKLVEITVELERSFYEEYPPDYNFDLFLRVDRTDFKEAIDQLNTYLSAYSDRHIYPLCRYG